jgi:C_GCAxxG_C_C family probable redox protein
MDTHADKAIANFRSGLNCAQSVLLAYSGKFNIDDRLALGLACGFGGGMGRLQKTCGLVTGAFMVFGAYNCSKYEDNKERKAKTYTMVQDFDKRFKALYGTDDCMDLLQYDLNTEEGQRIVAEKNLHELICEKCMREAIRIIDEMVG